MKLYYGRATCSLSCHIALREAHQQFELVRFDLPSHKLEDGRLIEAVNPKGYVPVLELDDGQRLTEASVVLQYIADRPGANLAPPFGTFERYQMQEWLNFVATREAHRRATPAESPGLCRGVAGWASVVAGVRILGGRHLPLQHGQLDPARRPECRGLAGPRDLSQADAGAAVGAGRHGRRAAAADAAQGRAELRSLTKRKE
jgi:glutathione S-transferase